MSEMAERVARALLQQFESGGRLFSQDEAKALAWGVIRAMRELPDDYFAAVVKALGCRNDEAHRAAVRDVHQTWIDEALK